MVGRPAQFEHDFVQGCFQLGSKLDTLFKVPCRGAELVSQ
jgi:hypothetical protein